MTKYFIFLVALGLTLYACSTKPEQKKPVITFEMKTFRVESEGGCKADTIPCALYEVEYPVFSGLDSSVNRQLQTKIDASVSMGNPEAEGETMEQVGKGFIADYNDFKKEAQDIPMGWHYSATVAVETQTDSLLSLSVAEEYFTGGAHGGYGTFFINVKPSTGDDYALADYFKPGFEEPLRLAAEQAFRKERELEDSVSLADNFFEFPDNKFQLNQNFGFTKDGIVFFFNSYEIAAYAAGPTEVVVPYEIIKTWIK